MVILPHVRTSFGRNDAAKLVHLLAERGEDAEGWNRTLAERGIDPLLDSPLLSRAVLDDPGVSALPLEVISYILLRRSLLDVEVEDRLLADYVTSLFLHFSSPGRAQRIAEYDDREYVYLVDIVGELAGAEGQRAFLLRAHLGNLSLWLSGLFPDWIDHRVHRRGGPPLDYYEQMGQTGFTLAAEDPHARQGSLDAMFRSVARHFVPIRRALNGFSDRFLTPRAESPVDRVLRQVRDGFEAGRLQA